MNFLIKDLDKLKKFSDYTAEIVEKRSPIVLSGLSSVGKIQLIEATKEYTDKNICIITYNEIQARKIIKDLQYFSSNVLYFPKREIASYDYIAENKDLPYERIDTLNKIYAESNYCNNCGSFNAENDKERRYVQYRIGIQYWKKL